MLKKTKFEKKTWLKIIPKTIYFSANKKPNFFIKNKHISYFILNWNKIWFYLYYQLNILKNTLSLTPKLLFITDYIFYKNEIKLIAQTTNSFFAIGAWKGGILSNIYWYKFRPTFIINFGMFYLKRYNQELEVVCIPNIFFTNINRTIAQYKTFTYYLLFLQKNKQIFHYFCFFFIFLIKNYFNNTRYALIKKNYKKTIKYLKYVRNLKKNKIFFLSNKFKNFYLNTKLNIKKNLKNNKYIYNNINFIKTIFIKKYYSNFILKKNKIYIFLKIKKKYKTLKKKTHNLIFKIFLYTRNPNLLIQTHKKPILFNTMEKLKLKKKLNTWIDQQFSNLSI